MFNLTISAELMVSRGDRWGNTDHIRAIGELQLWINGVCVIHAKGLISETMRRPILRASIFRCFFIHFQSRLRVDQDMSPTRYRPKINVPGLPMSLELSFVESCSVDVFWVAPRSFILRVSDTDEALFMVVQHYGNRFDLGTWYVLYAHYSYSSCAILFPPRYDPLGNGGNLSADNADFLIDALTSFIVDDSQREFMIFVH